MERISKINMYLNCAENFAGRSTCLRRKYGAVLVKNDTVISTGYNGSPRGMENCCDMGVCFRIQQKIPHGTGYSYCKSVHAEMNVLLNCSREQTIDSDLYLTGVDAETGTVIPALPCPICARLIIQAGVKNVYTRTADDGSYELIKPEELTWFLEASE